MTKYLALKSEFYAKRPEFARFLGDVVDDFLLRSMVKFGDKSEGYGAWPVFGPMSVRFSGVHDECKNSEFLNAK